MRAASHKRRTDQCHDASKHIVVDPSALESPEMYVLWQAPPSFCRLRHTHDLLTAENHLWEQYLDIRTIANHCDVCHGFALLTFGSVTHAAISIAASLEPSCSQAFPLLVVEADAGFVQVQQEKRSCRRRKALQARHPAPHREGLKKRAGCQKRGPENGPKIGAAYCAFNRAAPF